MKFIRTTIEELRKKSVEIGRYPNGDIDYYFNKKGDEIGHVIFPGYSIQMVNEIDEPRIWNKKYRGELNMTKI